MPEPLRWDMILANGQPLRYDMGPEYVWDGDVPASAQPTPPPMSEDNRISAVITPATVASIRQKFQEIIALCPVIEQLDDVTLKRLLGIDQSTEIDDIAAEAVDAHPEFNSPVVSLPEFAKDRVFLAATTALEPDAETTLRYIQLMRRYASSDVRKASLAIYHILAEFADRGNIAAQGYYDRMSVFFPGRPKKTPPTPPTP